MSLFPCNLLQMLCSSSSIRNCTTDTSTLKSAWVTLRTLISLYRLLRNLQNVWKHFQYFVVNIVFLIIRVDQLWTRGLSRTTTTATSSTTFSVSHWMFSIFFSHLYFSVLSYRWWKTSDVRMFMIVNRCWWPRPSGAAKPVAVGHHWWVHLPGTVRYNLVLSYTKMTFKYCQYSNGNYSLCSPVPVLQSVPL